ncbi:hypothetical protein LCGC14_1852700 [marine sediment metagenome]|uniref:Uncharacterized protein n=1 Tax=marine sediment metagenome TaxID=412755 RepID=A0A0F9GA60_9ZZZZ
MAKNDKPVAGVAPRAKAADPLAGKSAAEKKATLEAAKAKDEAAVRPAAPAPKPKAGVDEKVKAEALVLMAAHAEAVQAWRDAKALKTELSVVLKLRTAGKALKKQLNVLYGKDSDSVQAAETAWAAKKE